MIGAVTPRGEPTGRSGVKRRDRAVMAAIVLLLALPAQAEPVRVAVADFDYTDSSGEVTGQRTAHAERLRALKAAIVDDPQKNPRCAASPLGCSIPPCSANALDQSSLLAAARAQNARFVLFGDVRKMSMLIQWGEVDVMDTATGKAALSRTVTFRGDSDDPWRYAADYIGQMIASSIGAIPPPGAR